jgi:hypothetical protein
MCDRCGSLGYVFDCPKWPQCGCPDGTVAADCPGKTIPCPVCAVPPVQSGRSSMPGGTKPKTA